MVVRAYIRRFRIVMLGSMLVALLAACGGPQIALVGKVTDDYTGKPVPSATVKLGSAEVTTDAEGRYTFPRWNSKDTIEVKAGGYEQRSVPLQDQPQFSKPAPPSVSLDVVIRPNTLSGTVSDSYTKQPLAGAVVQASATISATTAADGRYVLNGVPESFALSITAPEHEPADQSVSRQSAFNAVLRPNVVVGTVTDRETGKPVGGIKVAVGNTATTTDEQGRYRLEGVPQDAVLEIGGPGYVPVSQPVSQTVTLDVPLEPNVLTGTITDFYTAAPVRGATIAAGGATATTEADGRYRLVDAPKDGTVEIDAPGYAKVTETVPDDKVLDAALRPDMLSSQLVDAQTGNPIKNATIIATRTPTDRDDAFTRIDNSTDGRFTLEGLPEQGFIQVLAPGYRKAVIEIKPNQVPPTIKLEPFYVRAAYITAAVASAGPDLVNEYFDLIDQTELNALVIDLKSDLRDDLGLVYYLSQTPLVQELDTSVDYVDLPALLAEAKKRNIYTIARVQVFSHDNALADARPDWTIKDRATGKTYADLPGPGIRYAWLDPWNRNVWDYNIQLSIEAAQLGFDEINFDYIRYPDAGDLKTYKDKYLFSQPTDPANDPEAMYNNIATFMKEAQRAINGTGAFFSVDVFGRVVIKPSVPISQDITRMAQYADYVCPMPYPSLWWPGYLDFDNPTAHPYEVILGSLQTSLPQFEGKYARLRPWLQDHTDPWQGSRVVEYGPKEVRAQIDATEQVDEAAGWMLYDSANTYTEGALKPER